ncbi:MAG: hypothetical protein DI536_04195 [Archangium gephyra]|uniref:Terminase n=1 Tax=Archangium gephyra TaxID=48 RepID=A0A2W5W2Z5_9BACT|nr:MAG: hypothetical protein DI536_04195 [Archangium gephyra]
MSDEKEEREAAIRGLMRWRSDVVAFARECLGFEPDDWQLEYMRALTERRNRRMPSEERKRRFALKACVGPGKTAVLAIVVWWFISTRVDAKGAATSITDDNLKANLWAELAKWQDRSPFLKKAFEWTATQVRSRERPATWFIDARRWAKSADPNTLGNTLAGLHGDNVIFVIDEAGGVPAEVAAAAEGGLANVNEDEGREAIFLIAGNPTHLSGPLYAACTRDAARWHVQEITGDPDNPRRAKRISIVWAREMIASYGRDSDVVKVKVLGQFPSISPDSLLGPDDVSRSMLRVLPDVAWKHEVKILGVDVARQGDDRTVLMLRQGPVAFRPRVLRIPDLFQVSGQVAQVINQQNPDAVFIDIAMGAGVADNLRAWGHDVTLVPFSAADYDGQFKNVRAGMWWRMAQWVRTVGATPDMPELRAELVVPKYKFDAASKLQLESKEEIKKRLGYSPDVADALALTFTSPVATKKVREEIAAATGRVAKGADYNPYARG